MRWLSGRTVAASHDGGRRSGVLCSAFYVAEWARVDSFALHLQKLCIYWLQAKAN